MSLACRRPLPETPPRAWGRLTCGLEFDDSVRNTPTCVGKTSGARGRWTRRRKHPHVRGEDQAAFRLSPSAMETPPRAWGRPVPGCHCCGLSGNTPTCVGKTPSLHRNLNHGQKHPHVRGEDFTWLDQRYDAEETPPRAWGRPECGAWHVGTARNTPTCVGKTHEPIHPHQSTGKHPHVRGEDKNPLGGGLVG